jgi:hypothetical protein
MKRLRAKGKPPREIAAELNRQKVLHRGQPWKPRTIGYMLRKEGINVRNKRR